MSHNTKTVHKAKDKIHEVIKPYKNTIVLVFTILLCERRPLFHLLVMVLYSVLCYIYMIDAGLFASISMVAALCYILFAVYTYAGLSFDSFISKQTILVDKTVPEVADKFIDYIGLLFERRFVSEYMSSLFIFTGYLCLILAIVFLILPPVFVSFIIVTVVLFFPFIFRLMSKYIKV